MVTLVLILQNSFGNTSIAVTYMLIQIYIDEDYRYTLLIVHDVVCGLVVDKMVRIFCEQIICFQLN